MNSLTQKRIEKAIVQELKNAEYYAGLCSKKQLNPDYMANQISAFIGELCGHWIDAPYASEKLENARRMLQNICAKFKME